MTGCWRWSDEVCKWKHRSFEPSAAETKWRPEKPLELSIGSLEGNVASASRHQPARALPHPPEQGVTPIYTDCRSHQDGLDRYRKAPRAPEGHSKLLGMQEAEDPLHLQLWGRPHCTLHWLPTPRAGMREPGRARGDRPAYCTVPAVE